MQSDYLHPNGSDPAVDIRQHDFAMKRWSIAKKYAGHCRNTGTMPGN
jgi:hypothetical protein